jgi:23S rRNA pseudouridine955/2504/2580 synthase
VRDLEKKRVYISEKQKAGSKEIITKYRRIAPSTLEVELVTGRTHQIRAHLAHLGYRLIGDTKYGNAKGKSRQHLVASKIVFLDIPNEMELSYLSNKTFEIM